MGVVRWSRAVVLVVGVVASVVGAGASPGTSPALASDRSWQPPPCPPIARGRPAPGTAAWYRLAPVIDATGTLVAQRLETAARGATTRTVDLPAESFASGPAQGQLVVGSDDGRRSRLQVVDLERGCVRFDAVESAVIRSAITTLDGAAVWEHRVDRETRADLGVWRRSLDDGGSVQVLPGIEADPAYGPTFVTDLRESSDGHLLVASCGALACRTRILGAGSARVGLVPDTGPVIGFADGRLVAHAACDAWPCAIVSVAPDSGRRWTLLDRALEAELGGPGDGNLVYQAPDGELASLDLASRSRHTLVAGRGLAPLRRGSLADAGADLRPGRVLVAADGELDGTWGAWQVDPATDTLSMAGEFEP
jgi:hypothetical protein